MRLSLTVEGDLFTGMTLKDIRVTPIGDSPVESVSVEQLDVRYKFLFMLQRGVSDFITGYEIKNASVVVNPVRGTLQLKKELAEALRNILQQPALFSNRIHLDNINVSVTLPEGTINLKGLDALLDTRKTGYVRVGEFSIPGHVHWTAIETNASYKNRKLVIRDFRLGDDVYGKKMELDGSQRRSGISYLSFEGYVFGGSAEFFLWRKELGFMSSEARFTASCSGVRLDEASRIILGAPTLSGVLNSGWVSASGNLDQPEGWQGDALLNAKNVKIGAFTAESVSGVAAMRDKLAKLDVTVAQGANELLIQAERVLPTSTRDLLLSGVSGRFTFKAPEITSDTLPQLAAGGATGSGEFKIEDTLLHLTGGADWAGVKGWMAEQPFALETSAQKLDLYLDLNELGKATLQTGAGVSGSFSGTFSGLQWGDYALDSGEVAASFRDAVLLISRAEIQRGSNSLRASGGMDFTNATAQRAPLSLSQGDLSLHWTLDAPRLAELNGTDKPIALAGAFKSSGAIERKGTVLSGSISAHGENLVYREFSARSLTLDSPIQNDEATVRAFKLAINGKDELNGEGRITLNAPYAYEASLNGSVRDLSVFQPLVQSPLAGSLTVNWHGAGALTLLQHTGEVRLTLRDAAAGALSGIDGEIAGTYSPESIEIGTFKVRSDQGGVDTVVRLKNERLQLDPLKLELPRGGGFATGRISVPLDLRTATRPEMIFPKNGQIDGRISISDLDLAKAVSSIAALPLHSSTVAAQAPATHKGRRTSSKPVSTSIPQGSTELSPKGRLSATVSTFGTVEKPEFQLAVKAQEFCLFANQALAPCSVELKASLKESWLAVAGAVSQPGMRPLQFSGGIPLDIKKTVAQGRVTPDTPLQFSVKLAPSPAAILMPLLPNLRYVEGEVAIDASANGTLGKPYFDGSISLKLPAVRFNNSEVPGVGNFVGELQFAGNDLTIKRFQGDIAGGPFAATGLVNLENLTDPALEIWLKSTGTLLFRDDALTVRANSDLRLSGPLSQAVLAGKVELVKSRFVKDVEIIPLGLPGRSAPPIKKTQSFSIDTVPLRNWRFDIAIRTKDPFSIHGNLAAGMAYGDVHLAGSGLAPTLDGMIRLDNFAASLPFSTLTVDYGYAYFTPGDPTNPTLDIRGSSQIRDYHISTYVYGTASEPQTLFTSEPPLAQEEIIALLATGATTREFTENNQVLATRAGFLLLQDLYYKAFRKQNPQRPREAGRNPLERFHLELGTVDPKTGRQEVSGRFKITNEYELGAGIDLQGDTKVQLRYLLRFR